MSATGDRRCWYFAVIFAAIAFCTLEVSFVLILTLLICCYRERLHLSPDWKFGLNSALLFLAVVLTLWPAAILRLSFIKAYCFMAYLALFRSSAWGGVSLLESWHLRLMESPFEWALIVVAIFLYFRTDYSPIRKLLYPFLVYTGLMLLVLLRVGAQVPRYQLPFLPALDLFAAYTVAARLSTVEPRLRYVFATAICLGVLWNTERQNRLFPARPDQRSIDVVAFVRRYHLEDKKLLIPHDDLPEIHYYFPRAHLQEYYQERPTPSDLDSGPFAAVLFPGSHSKIGLSE
jgi:hypothetical protein